MLPPIDKDANKYSRGSLLIIAGSARYPGAAVLAAQAAARAGAGYVSLAVPSSVVPIAQSHLLTVPVLAAQEQDGAFAADGLADLIGQAKHLDAILCGPGMTVTSQTHGFLAQLLRQAPCPLVLDADALNLLAGWAGGEPLAGGSPAAVEPLYPLLPPESILTPHGGELDRLLQATGADSAEQLALTLQATILAKGPQTVVYPHESGRSSYRYTDGTPALAKAGTGDVLAGIIAALLAQGATAWQAAVSGVQLHGRAGLLAEMNGSRRSLIARDIIDGLPHALREIEGI